MPGGRHLLHVYISSCIASNRMKLNVKKTHVMIMSKKSQENAAERIQLSLDNKAIAKWNEVKHLEVFADKQLRWRSHNEKIRKKCLCPHCYA